MFRHMIYRLLISTLAFFCFSLFSYGHETSLLPKSESTDCPSDLVQEKLDYYRKQYPDILFIVLAGGSETNTDMITLDTLLGPEPTSLDYEHPADLREELMLASAQRIWMMLHHQLPSAALFRADNPLDWQETICVITLDACAVAATDIDATGSMLDLPDTMIHKIPKKMQLSKKEYIKYTFDHEAYHCLKSKLLGPQKMSKHALWGEYSHYKEEKAADSYALAMHIREHESLTPFFEKLRRIRGVSLYSFDPDHLTCDAITELTKIPVSKISAMSDQEIFRLATRIKQDLTGDYEGYVQYLASAIEAASQLGVNSAEMEKLRKRIGTVKPDPELVRKLLDRSRECHAELQGKDLER